MIPQYSILRRKDLKIVDDFVKEAIGESGTKHWKEGYVISLHIWIQADPWSDIIVFDSGKADLKIIIWSDDQLDFDQ
jgi:hypothetical protein